MALVFLAVVIGLPALGAAPARAVSPSAYSWVLTGGSVQPAYQPLLNRVQTASGVAVLAAGGQANDGYTDATWLYDPAAELWTESAPMGQARYLGDSTVLNDGRVLVAGGDRAKMGWAEPTFQLYDPKAGVWSAPRALPHLMLEGLSATKLLDGRVLIAGGAFNTAATREAYLFDPATNSLTATGLMKYPRYGHGATLLPDGRVFVVGGYGTVGWQEPASTSAEIYDPATGTWSSAASPLTVKWHPVRTESGLPVLPDGRVMVLARDDYTQYSEIYNPVSDTWSMTVPPETGQTSILANLGGGLVVQTAIGESTRATHFFISATDTWTVGPRMPAANQFGRGVVLPSGDLLITGGAADDNSSAPAHAMLLALDPGRRDTTPPTLTVEAPADGVEVDQGTPLTAKFTCTDPVVAGQVSSGISGCSATVSYHGPDDVNSVTVSSGATIDTSLLGRHRMDVMAIDMAGYSVEQRVIYTVVQASHVPSAIWSGRLLTSDGVPASGVDVSLSALSADGVSVCGRDEVCTVSRTDAQGRFSLTVEARTNDNPINYQLRLDRVAGSDARAGDVVLPVFSLGQGTISDLVADRSQDITLPALRKVTVRVQDAAGDPVADAVVRLPKVDQSDEPPMTDLFWSPAAARAESASTHTDAQGEATFYAFGSSTPLYVEARFHDGEDRAFSAFRSVTATDTDTTVVIRQPDAVTWSGQVLTTEGVPASGVDVSASALSPDGHPVCGTDARCAVSRTDADGRFAVTVEARSGDNPVDYRMELDRAADAAARAGEVVLPVFRVGLGTVTDFMSDRSQDITMPSLVKVTVHTVDADGAAVAGAELRLPEVDQSDEPPISALYWTPAAVDGESASTHTDAQGEATFSSLSSAVPLAVEARFPVPGGGTVSSFRTVVAEAADTTLTITAPQAATLSGRVLNTDGVPASGVDVSLSALSVDGRPLCGDGQVCAVSRTDAQGAFALTVEARSDENPVDYAFSVDRVAGAQARAGDAVLPVFHLGQGSISDLVGDRTQDVTLPALVKVSTLVQDARGEPVRGVALHLGAVDQSDEPPMTALYWSPAPDDGESASTLSDAGGHAAFYSFGSSTPLRVSAVFSSDAGAVSLYRSVVADTDTTLEIQAPDGYFGEADTDDVSDALEDKVPSLSGTGTGDGNGDGVPDSEQLNVASLPAYGTTDVYVTIAAPQGTALTHVVAVDPASVPAPPADVAVPRALTSFMVTGIPEGTRDETVSIYVDSTAGLEGYAKYDQQTGWTLLPDDRVTIVDAHRIDITLTDGGVGDADGVVNGSIDDPGGPVWGSLATGTPTVSDTTPNVGQHLWVNEGTWGAARVGFAYQWLRTTSAGSTTEIPAATAREYTVAADDLGCTLRVRVIGSSAGYIASTRTSAATAKVKAGTLSPTQTPSLSSTTPVTDGTVTANPGVWGPDGVALTYQWYRKSASGKVKSITGATAGAYQARAGDVGYRLRVRVTGALAGYTSVSRYSVWSVKVARAPFTAVPTPTVDAVVRVGMPLTAAPGAWEPTATFTYQWYRVSATGTSSAISGATRATYTPTVSQTGQTLKVRVTGYRSGYVTTAAYSAATTAVQPGMAGGTPRVTGTPVVDQELTADEGTWSPGEATFSYQWYARSSSGKVYKVGADSRTYRVEGRYAGYKVKVAVTGHATGYASVTRTSSYTSTIAKATFTSQSAPTIDGVAQVGETLTATEGDWQPTPLISYQWYRSGTAITGATRDSYTLTSKDVGKTITIRVTAKRPGYVTASRTSAATNAIAA